MDNGGGMTPETLHKMLGFGHSDKKEIDGHRQVWHLAFASVLRQHCVLLKNKLDSLHTQLLWTVHQMNKEHTLRNRKTATFLWESDY